MIQWLQGFLAAVLPAPLRSALRGLRALVFDVHVVRSYSQEGEDLLLKRFFARQETGFYVDVGAHHPRRFSNTYGFYRLGWRGINIEPNPYAFRLFKSARARDINLQCGVSDRRGDLTYYLFDDPALNTFDEALATWRLANTPYKLIGRLVVPVERLDDILLRSLPEGQVIDFLSIDVEGFDFAVLQSNDWRRFRPSFVLVEALGETIEDVMRGPLFAFMKSHEYELLAKTYNTLIFRARIGGDSAGLGEGAL